MASKAEGVLARLPWRMIGWGGAAALLALPFVAMQFTREVDWNAADFLFAGVMVGGVGGAFELAVRMSRSWAYRSGAGLALLGAFLIVWSNFAVGIVGSEENPANLWFFGALLVGLVGATAARFRPSGTAAAMLATAASLGVAFVIAASGPTDEPWVPHSREGLAVSVFAALFLASAALFRKASGDRAA